MTNCKYITKNGRCGLKGSYAYRHGCFGEDMCRCREPMTNADRIRAMNDEELAEFLWNFNLADVSTDKLGEFGPHMFRYRLKEWLQMPVEEDDHDERKENEHV